MAIVTRIELENAQRDVTDLGKVINGAANVANPGHDNGTVTTRLNQTIKTLSKLVADGQQTVEARLSPKIYFTIVERENDLANVIVGQTGFDKESTNLYICIMEDIGDPPVSTKVWHQLSNLQLAASADFSDLLRRKTSVGRVSVDDYEFLRYRERFFNRASEMPHIQWPGKSGTANGGLHKMLGFTSAWPTRHMLQPNVDFGCRVPYANLINVAAIGAPTYDWISATKRIAFRNNNPNYVSGLRIDGYIDINNGYQKSATIVDCWVDTNYEKLQAIQKNNGPEYPVKIEYCTLRRFTAEATVLYGGHIAYCDIELSRGDGLKAGGTNCIVHGNLVRLLGQDLVTAHGDCLQVLDCIGLEVTGNTFYMPGTGTQWDEATYGSTQALRLITENSAHRITDTYVAGNLFVGGGFTVAVRARVLGSLVENVVIANNMIAGKKTNGGATEYPYWVYGPISKEHWIENNPGTIRNLIFYNNRMTDGTNFATEGPGVPQGGTDQNGLWHYSKEHATPRFLELGKRYGMLDWNGDPLVTVRTTG